MKGIVFTEFLEMVEASYSEEMVERIIADADVPSGGAYTSIGTYDYREMAHLVTSLSRATGTAPAALLCAFGRYLFGRFALGYGEFFAGHTSAFGFLKTVEGFIHIEVQKLYPDAELPRFDVVELGPDALQMDYTSSRRLADLAEGLILGCGAHFGEPLEVRQEDLSGDGTRVRLHISRARSA